MIVGFEVVACSIKRKPGQAINKGLMCPQSLDDPNAPEPQEVKKGGWAQPKGGGEVPLTGCKAGPRAAMLRNQRRLHASCQHGTPACAGHLAWRSTHAAAMRSPSPPWH